MNPLDQESPLGRYRSHLRQGELAYQRSASGAAVFYPRVLAPGDGSALAWAISKGLGTVYATTTVHNADGTTHNVALIDLDEGFRMMSRVDGIGPSHVHIGLSVRFVAGTDAEGEPLALFVPASPSGAR